MRFQRRYSIFILHSWSYNRFKFFPEGTSEVRSRVYFWNTGYTSDLGDFDRF